MKVNKSDIEVNKVLTKSTNLFPVVGIGASAGGLDAFKKFIKAIPENSGIAYVLVQHLDPQHESLLPELLQKVTTIPVLEISDEIKVVPDHIYIIPSNKMLLANDGVLELSPRPLKNKSGRNLPIDLFFTSLSEVHQSHAIGIVLSGTGYDGTLGLKAIKEQGGITFAQDENSALYTGMPQNAVQAGVADFILPPQEMPEKLMELTEIINKDISVDEDLPPEEHEVFKQILTTLRLRKGTDFTYYKQTTIRRRILRRMALNKNQEPTEYLKYLRENIPEQDTLYQDILISVTSFFRDAKTFDNLCEKVFPLLIKRKTAPGSIRIWIAGCSTGQEAYSIAICFKEILGDTPGSLQIFASDISEQAIVKARAGYYSKSELEGISPSRLQEFFTKTNGDYKVNKSIRDTCVFAVHNFLKDPPFGKLDLISCRNVLIYLEPYLQKKALTTFHYALEKKGLLLLGKSETVSSVPELFASAGYEWIQGTKNEKLFIRKDVSAKFVQVASQKTEQRFVDLNTNPERKLILTDFQKTADDILLSKYTPAGVVVNEAMDIVHFRGSNGNYLEPSPGKASLNLLKMAKQGLAFDLRTVLHKAKKSNSPVVKKNIPVQINGSNRLVSIEAIPLPNILEPHFLILFHEDNPESKEELLPQEKGNKIKADAKDLRIQQLEMELLQTREDMRNITESQQAANEELQSANEELMSGSEELHSLNEEMETSKEELQSSNEELIVVNQEMISLNEQVTEARNYAEGIVTTIREPLLVLDKYLRVKMANRAFYKTFQVNEHETEGRLIYELGDKHWNIATLRKLLEEILLKKTVFTDFEVKNRFPVIGERVMLLNAREITNNRTDDKLILLSIEDVTEKVKFQQKEKELLSRFQNMLSQAPVAIMFLKGRDYVAEIANDTFLQIVEKEKDFIGRPIFESLPELESQGIRQLLDQVRESGIQYIGNEVAIELSRHKKKKQGFYNFIYQPVREEAEQFTGIIVVVIEVTEQVLARKKVEESEGRFRNLVEKVPYPICILKGEEMILDVANEPVFKVWHVGKEALGKPFLEIIPEMKDQPFMGWLLDVFHNGVTHYGYEELAYFTRENGEKESVYFNFVYQPYYEDDGTLSGVMVLATDVSEQVSARKKIEESEERFRSLADQAPIHVFIIEPNAEASVSYWNKYWLDYTGQTMEEAKDRSWDGIIHPDDVPSIMDVYVPAFEKRQSYFLPSIRVKRYDGEYRWHMVKSHPRYLPNGEFMGFIGVGVDIHEQKLADELIKYRTALLEAHNEASIDGILLVDAKGKIISYNQRFTEIWNMPKEIVAANDDVAALAFATKQLVNPEKFIEKVNSLYEDPTEISIDELEFKSGAIIERHGYPVKDKDGSFYAWSWVFRDITDRRLHQLKEKELLHKFQSLVKQAPIAICIFREPNHLIELANEKMLRFWDRKAEQVMNKPVFEAMPELKGQGFEELLRNVYTTGKSYNSSEVMLNMLRNGKPEKVYIKLLYEALYNEDGTISGVIAVVDEVTELVIARKQMEAQATMVQELLMTAPGFVCTLVGPDHVYGLVNERYQQLFGKRKIVGKPILVALPELKGQGFDTLLDKVYNTGEIYVGIDVPIKLSRDEDVSPELRYFNFSYQPMYNEDKKIYSILVFGYEVTDQVIAKNKNLEDQRLFSKALEEKVDQRTLALREANESLQQKNEEIALSKYNKRFLAEFSEKFSDYKPHNEFFNSLVQFIADTTSLDYVFVGHLKQNEKGKLTIQTMALFALGKLTENIQYALPNGPCEQVISGTVYSYPNLCMKTFPKSKVIQEFFVEGYIGYPLNDEQGNAVGLIGVMHRSSIEDIDTVSSVLKIVARRAEIELERIKHEEALVRNNKILEEKNEALVNMNKELNAFSYVASHDLQEPLRKIKTFANLLLENEKPNLSVKGKDYLNRMQMSAFRMQSLIEDLLSYSQINIPDRKFEYTDLNLIIDEVVTEFADIIQEKNAVVDVEAVVEVYIIPFQFRQLIHNLISNALKFSNPGIPPHIVIKSEIAKGDQLQYEQLTPGKNYCHISVRDNGIGFDPQYKERIFEVFQRLYGKSEYEGTGIGLAIVKKIIDNHNGIITASGEINKGATFDIYIPHNEI